MEVLKLQQLAISEARARRPAFFVAHVGCAAPPVWQNREVLKNFNRMHRAGVKISLSAGLANNNGEPIPSVAWPMELRDKLMQSMDLRQQEVDTIFWVLPKKLRNHSVAAGSEQHSRIYIASHEEKNIYPTSYFTVDGNKADGSEACQEWKNYLLAKHLEAALGH